MAVAKKGKKLSLSERLMKNSTQKARVSVMKNTQFYDQGVCVATPVPAFNLAMSGTLFGGFESGVTLITGPSKHFKSNMCLMAVAAFLNKYEDGICLYYDNEFGTPLEYLESFGIDTSRVIHTPIANIEEFKFDIMQQLEGNVDAKGKKLGDGLTREDKVMIFIDSVGNMASKKEVDDAMGESGAADMTRAKQLKSVFRMITPLLNMKDIPLFAVNHTYKSQERFSKDIVSGGTGLYLSANTIIIISRRQIKKAGEAVEGYEFILNIEKSRFIREGSKIPITVRFDNGIESFSGLLDMAIELGYVSSPKVGWYSRPSVSDDKSWRKNDTNCAEFWKPLLSDTAFPKDVSEMYKLPSTKIVEAVESPDTE